MKDKASVILGLSLEPKSKAPPGWETLEAAALINSLMLITFIDKETAAI